MAANNAPVERPLVSALLQCVRRIPLWQLAVASLSGYALLALWFPLPGSHDRVPVGDIRSFAPSLLEGVLYGALLLVLFGLYALACVRVASAERPPEMVAVVGTSLLYSLPLLLVYPVNANDLYRYLIRGRIHAVYGQSPFTVAPEAFPQDPWLPLAGEWADATSPYGPVWELLSSLTVRAAPGDLLLSLLLFKALALLFFAASGVVIWFLLQSARDASQPVLAKPAARAAYALQWLWNPALLLIFVANGHNDVVMIFWLLLGLLAMRRGYPLAGLLLMVLALLTKPVAVLALPLFVIQLWRQQGSWQKRLGTLATLIAGAAALGALTFWPFGSPKALASRLLAEAAAGGGFSPSVLLILVARSLGSDTSVMFVARAGAFLFLLLALFLAWRTWRGRPAVRGVADLFGAYLLQALNFRIWYAAWPFPWLLVDQAWFPARSHSYRLHVGHWFLIVSQLSVLIYGHLRVSLLGGSQLQAHLLGVLFTFGAPFLLARCSSASVVRHFFRDGDEGSPP